MVEKRVKLTKIPKVSMPAVYLCPEHSVVLAKIATIDTINANVEKIVNTLIGEEKPGSVERTGGLVNEVQEMKNGIKSKLSGRDKALIIAAFITAAAGIIAALLK